MLDFTAVLDLFGFLPLFEFLKSDKSLIPMWAAPAAERCFEYINDISYLEHDYQKHFPWIQKWRWYNDSNYEYIDGHMRLGQQFFMSTLGECNYLRFSDRQRLVSLTTQDVEIDLSQMMMHQCTRWTKTSWLAKAFTQIQTTRRDKQFLFSPDGSWQNESHFHPTQVSAG